MRTAFLIDFLKASKEHNVLGCDRTLDTVQNGSMQFFIGCVTVQAFCREIQNGSLRRTRQFISIHIFPGWMLNGAARHQGLDPAWQAEICGNQ